MYFLRMLAAATVLAISCISFAEAAALPLPGIVHGGQTVAPIATHCDCTFGYTTPSGGVCTTWSCGEMLRSAQRFKRVRNRYDCPKSRALVCGEKTCHLVCEASGAKKK